MSEKNKSRASKKWLLSRMKTSGSKKRYAYSPDYADTRNAKHRLDFEMLPKFESMSRKTGFYGGKVNADLLRRFLFTQVGNDWDEVYSEIMARIPSKLFDYKYYLYFFVADKVAYKEEKLFNLRDQSFIETNTEEYIYFRRHYRHMDFYVDPESNQLCRIGDFKSRKKTRDLDKRALRVFRETERKAKLSAKRNKKLLEQKQAQKVTEILRTDKKH